MAMQSGGYDYEFVDTPSDTLICQICHCPSIEPHLSLCCGHTFCKSCLEAAKGVEFVTNACPMCRNEQFVTFPNKQADRIIKSLYVYCSNKKKGCEWQGEVNAITNHLNNRDGCQFQEVNCPNDCEVAYQRQYLTSHVETECPRRKVNCQYCHNTGECQFIEGQHKEECPKLPLPCPNNCKVRSVPREDMEKHRRECLLEIIDCVSQCGKKLARWCLTSHIETECPRRKVNCQYCHDTGEHQFIEGQHKEECPKFPLPCPNKCKIDNIPRDGLREHINICPLQLIQCKYHVVGCEAIMARKDQKEHNKEKMEQHLSLSVNELAVNKSMIKQLSANQKDAQKTIDNLTKKLAIAEREISALKGKAPVIRPFMRRRSTASYMADVKWRGYLDTQAAKMLSGNEVIPVVLKMSEFTEKKRRKSDWFSEPFFTHASGYKIQLNVLPNDDGCSHMSVCLYIMKGPYDEQLRWPMKGEYTVKLLNQYNDSMHHSVTCSINKEYSEKPTTTRNPFPCCNSSKFISHVDLIATYRFLKDDNIYIRVCEPVNLV